MPHSFSNSSQIEWEALCRRVQWILVLLLLLVPTGSSDLQFMTQLYFSTSCWAFWLSWHQGPSPARKVLRTGRYCKMYCNTMSTLCLDKEWQKQNYANTYLIFLVSTKYLGGYTPILNLKFFYFFFIFAKMTNSEKKLLMAVGIIKRPTKSKPLKSAAMTVVKLHISWMRYRCCFVKADARYLLKEMPDLWSTCFWDRLSLSLRKKRQKYMYESNVYACFVANYI